MKMNRRNVLLGLGAIATGGGAMFGSGAFSQVSADRTVDITATGDGAALLQLSNGTGATGIVGKTNASGDAGNQVIEFSAGSLNSDATTTWNAALTVKNTGQDDVNFKIVDGDGDSGTNGIGSGEELQFTTLGGTDLTGNTVTLTAGGGSIGVDVIVNLTGSNNDGNIPGSVTFQATKV